MWTTDASIEPETSTTSTTRQSSERRARVRKTRRSGTRRGGPSSRKRTVGRPCRPSTPSRRRSASSTSSHPGWFPGVAYAVPFGGNTGSDVVRDLSRKSQVYRLTHVVTSLGWLLPR
jgi:hypothetical protein